MNIVYSELFDSPRETVDLPFEYRLKIRHFLDKSVSFTMTKIKHRIESTKANFTGTATFHPRTLSDQEIAEKKQENITRAVRRAKQAVHFACRQIQADHMLTLTTRKNITDRDEYFEIFKRFVRLLREKDLINGSLQTRSEKRTWQYVAVPELQDRGAFHMHIACHGKQDLSLLRACWYVALGGSVSDKGDQVLGAVDVQFHKKRFSGLTELHKTFSLVRYLTKYISKGFEDQDQLGLQRYKVSNKIEKPITHKQFLMACFANNQKGFFEAMQEVLGIAEFMGVGLNFELWNRGEDVFTLKGYINE